MLPTINTMVLGLVSLPGMMTGQILAGANQLMRCLLIYFMLAAGTALDINCRAACLSRSVQFVTPVVPRPSEQGEVAL